MVGILILNWNGYEDTCQCISSLQEMDYDEFFIVVGDNGSSNDSLLRIKSYCNNSGFLLLGENPINLERKGIIIKDLKENNGFAKGNNMLLDVAQQYKPHFYLLLNNDTVVEKDFLEKLVSFHLASGIRVLTPLIMYYAEKTKVWNAGGKLLWGVRKYFYANKEVTTIKEHGYIPCTFITGCALFVTPDIIREDGRLLTEDFFFGEEDFDFSLRLKRNHIEAACVLNSVIYHKVSSSTKKSNNLSKNYIHYLNRYINMRHNMGAVEYRVWTFLNNIYVQILLVRKGNSFKKVRTFIKDLNRDAFNYDGVSKELFVNLLVKTDKNDRT